MEWSEISLGVVSFFFCCFCRTCTCPDGMYDTSLLSFQNSWLLCFSDAGQITLIRIQQKLFLVFCCWYPIKACGCQRNVLKGKGRIWSSLFSFVHICHLYFSDDFRMMTSLKIWLFFSRNNSWTYVLKLDLFYYEAEYPWRLLKVLAWLWLLLSFSFSFINSQSTCFSMELRKQVSRNKMYAPHCCQPLGRELWSQGRAQFKPSHGFWYCIWNVRAISLTLCRYKG